MRHNPDMNTGGDYIHRPVLWKEILGYIESASPGGKGYLADCTLGEGGHTEIILDRFPEIRVAAFERDPEILAIARQRLERFGDRVRFINDNFSRIGEYLTGYMPDVNYVLYDFGISSFHYDRSGRGFAFSKNEKLDMRLDNGLRQSAADIIHTMDEKKLADIFFIYGEERWSKKIAREICRVRQAGRIETTEDLARLVLRVIPRKFHVKNIHPATRVFQALRIVVNDELTAIEKSMSESFRYIGTGGRIMAISFHSLEDRIVKERFKQLARGCLCGLEPKYCGCTNRPYIKILTKKPVMAAMGEIEENPRARSAKLRVCERL